MKSSSGETKLALTGYVLLFQAALFIWYMNILFRSFRRMNRSLAAFFFVALIVTADIIAVKYLSSRKERILSIILISVFPFGVDVFLKYRAEFSVYIACSLTAAAASTVLLGAYLCKTRVSGKKDRQNSAKGLLRKCGFYLYFFVTLCMTLLLVRLFISRLSGNNVISSNAPMYDPSEGTYSAEEHMDTLLLLQDDEWKKLTVQQKLDVMGVVANIEAEKLWISHSVTVGASDLNEKCRGRYSEETNTVDLELSLLEHGESMATLNTLCHEMRHCYQYQMVAEYNKAENASEALALYRNAAVYKEEFANYDELIEQGLHSSFECEIDASEYAKKEASSYFNLIKKNDSEMNDKQVQRITEI